MDQLVKYIENSSFVLLINNHISENELCIIKNEIYISYVRREL